MLLTPRTESAHKEDIDPPIARAIQSCLSFSSHSVEARAAEPRPTFGERAGGGATEEGGEKQSDVRSVAGEKERGGEGTISRKAA